MSHHRSAITKAGPQRKGNPSAFRRLQPLQSILVAAVLMSRSQTAALPGANLIMQKCELIWPSTDSLSTSHGPGEDWAAGNSDQLVFAYCCFSNR